MLKEDKVPKTILSPQRIDRSHRLVMDELSLVFDEKLNPNYKVIFATKTPSEVEALFKTEREYIDSIYILQLIACTEAYFRYEYLYRTKYRLKDTLSKELKALYAQKKEKAHFADDLLRIWKNSSTISNDTINRFCEVIKYRDWLAHGRYWILKGNLEEKYNYATVSMICNSLVEVIKEDSRVDYSIIPT